ncbi:hypothetical protein CJP46_26340 [Paenibacillus sp. XY044]|nr:hypothetical protein CJP46_26340 [Paenibacillus sp. XY044]
MKNPAVGMIAAICAISLLVGCNHEKNERLNLKGSWKLAEESQSSPGCFSAMKFLDDPTSDRDPISVHETTGNFTQIWFGLFEKNGSDIRVMLQEPEAEPFVMAAKRDGDELNLQYEWKASPLVCTYQTE